MDLEAFITTTLKSIKTGVQKSNEGEGQKFFKIQPSSNEVKFDVAVEIGKEKSTSGGGGLAIKVVQGNINKSSSSKESNITRISFSVSISTIID